MSTRTLRSSRALAALALAASLAACSVTQTITVKADGSGSASMHVEVSKLLREYLLDLQSVTGQTAAPEGQLFDTKTLQKDLAARPGLTVKKVSSPSPDVLDVELGFRSVEEVYGASESVKKSGVLVYAESGGQRSLKIHIDRKNFAELSAVFPAADSAAFAGIAPQEGDDITESEYLDMISFTLGPDGPALLKKSFVDVVIKPEGTIVSQSGGTVAGGAVTFRIPLLRLLLLDKPLDYAVAWK